MKERTEIVAVETRDLMKHIVATKGACIPAVIEDVREKLLFTKTKAKMLRSALEGIQDIDGAGEMHEALEEQHDEAWLASQYMTARLGELTREIPKDGTARATAARLGAAPPDNETKSNTLSSIGVSRQAASDAERLAANQWAIEEEFEKKKSKGKQPSQTGVLNRIRMKEAEEIAERKEKKQIARQVRETPRLVAEYFTALKEYRKALELAIAGAEKFDPHARNFITTKHEELRKLMGKLEEKV